MKAFKNKCYSAQDEENTDGAVQDPGGLVINSEEGTDQCSDENIDKYVNIIIILSLILSAMAFGFFVFAIFKTIMEHFESE